MRKIWCYYQHYRLKGYRRQDAFWLALVLREIRRGIEKEGT